MTFLFFAKTFVFKAQKLLKLLIATQNALSIDNIERLCSRENAGFAMVQSDVLNFIKRLTNPNMRKTANNLRLIFPFYNEEVHIFANKRIRQFEDIEGKRLVVGVERSGNWVTSNNLLHITDVEPAVKMHLAPAEGVRAVLEGKADAMVYVVGKPAPLFLNLDELKLKYPQLIEKVHFLQLDNPKILDRGYVRAKINSNDYYWFNSEITTVAVKAVLICYDFSKRNNDYYHKRCDELARLGRVIKDSKERLEKDGHPKWKEVNIEEDIEEDIGIWKKDKCSRQYLIYENSGNETFEISAEILNILKRDR